MTNTKTTNTHISVKKALTSLISGIVLVTCLFSIVCFNLNSMEKQIDSQKDKTQQQKNQEKQDLITNISLIVI